MYGTQTDINRKIEPNVFENDVKMYGTQTIKTTCWLCLVFENDVKMYGTQTYLRHFPYSDSLRMM